jgi:hypothetical protein
MRKSDGVRVLSGQLLLSGSIVRGPSRTRRTRISGTEHEARRGPGPPSNRSNTIRARSATKRWRSPSGIAGTATRICPCWTSRRAPPSIRSCPGMRRPGHRDGRERRQEWGRGHSGPRIDWSAIGFRRGMARSIESGRLIGPESVVD